MQYKQSYKRINENYSIRGLDKYNKYDIRGHEEAANKNKHEVTKFIYCT